MPLCFFSCKHTAFFTAHLPYEPLFLLFLSFLPLSVKELFTARTRCYRVAVIVILLYFSFPCQYPYTSFFNFFYFFISSLFCTAGAQHSSTKGDGTHHSTPPPASKLPSSKSPVLLFRGLCPCLFPEFQHGGFYRLSSSEVL